MAVIERVELVQFAYEVKDLGADENGVLTYEPNASRTFESFVLTIRDADGTVDEYCPMHSGKNRALTLQTLPLLADLVGRESLEREKLFQHFKRRYRHLSGVGYSAIDICLWDLFGKKVGLPIASILGGYRWELPAYASTLSGDRHGGLSSAASYADFATECRERGFGAFKMHCWSDGNPQDEIDVIAAVARAVGSSMNIMTDPASNLATFGDALRVGRACDEHGLFWYEDPLADGGQSPHVHRLLREQIRTPLLLTEHVRGLEAKSPWVTERATDFLRADPEYDLGITGVMKTAALAEAFGMDVELHSSGPAHRHCMSAIRNTNYYELALLHPRVRNPVPDIFACGYSDEIDAVSPKGTVSVPRGAGLGVVIDQERLAKLETGRVVYD